MKRFTSLLLIFILITCMMLKGNAQTAEAASNYITVKDFAKALANELNIPTDSKSNYMDELIRMEVIKEGDFKSYTAALKRGDMLVLLSRADDCLNHVSVDKDLIQEVIDKRISDIDKVAETKKIDTAKGFIRGFLKGYSNGLYSADRELKVNNKILRKDALNCLKMLKDTSLRAKISPDGQLIRTTKLPNNAYMFDYILASYPNRYYEGSLMFEGVTRRRDGVIVPLKSPEDYTFPKDVELAKNGGINDFDKSMDENLDMWMDKVYTRVWNTFNVNYKTIDDLWKETIAQTDADIYNHSEFLYSNLDRYVKGMKDNKTIVECNKVALDSSSLYYYGGFYYIRCYVRYRIVSSKTKTYYTTEELTESYWGPYNNVLYSSSSIVDIRGYTLGKWVDSYFDIALCTGVSGNTGSMFGVIDCKWKPDLFRKLER